MISPTATVLAVALPLLLCLLMLLGILLLRGRQLRAFDAIDQQRLRDKYAELEKRLATFPRAWDGQQNDTGFSRLEVQDSLTHFASALNLYVQKWILSDGPRNDSVTRIKALLFPEQPPKNAFYADKDTRIFPNPHQYAPAEICTLLEQANTRDGISFHIMMSILLRAISLDGIPSESLLRIIPPDIFSLDRLKTLIRGVDLSWNVRVHISKFGFYYVHKKDKKARFISLFESLFDPYFTMKSPADVAQRRLEFQNVLDKAIQHGTKAVGQANDKTEYRWGVRDDNNIMMMPALHALTYKDEKLEYDTEVDQSASCRAKWD